MISLDNHIPARLFESDDHNSSNWYDDTQFKVDKVTRFKVVMTRYAVQLFLKVRKTRALFL